ncbi:site-specific integrase [Paraburkholderia sp. 5N]|uniref:Site-specific integrase n=1 Tax=Paraburkholderia elongata TaxID=2675747 RepID=A0A972NXA4_9BURK|nr:site-specific integrase [Paraburkholderia elongata]
MPVVAPYVGTLPAIVNTRGGAVFDPHQDEWDIREPTFSAKLQFETLPELGNHFEAAFRSTLVWYAQNESLPHLRNLFYRARHLFEFVSDRSKTQVSEITSVDLLNYKSHVGPDREWYLGTVSGFLKRWRRLGYAGITEDAGVLLNQLRLKGNVKGVSTATMDPYDGPFTALELEALQMALNSGYAQHEVSLADYVLCWLLMMLGQRPTQYAALKVRDVVIVHEKGGSSTYSIRMPRAKGRDSDARGEFKDRVLTPEIGTLVARYAAEVKKRFTGLLDDPLDAPLFPGEQVDAAIAGYAFHQTSAQIGNKINAVMRRLEVISERTGDFIHIGPKRFRSTVGTRAAEEGHGELVIAELLDHSDTQNVGVYVNSTPAIVERIDRAVAMQLAPLAQAFAGKLIDGPSEASRRADPTSQIRAPGITGDFAAISSCGKHGFCGFLKPIACYTCNSFEPWMDGPHELVLDHLIAERERLMVTGDARIASINDRAILAVAEVIQLCETARYERSAAHG